MLINGISIDKYDAQLIDRTITPNEIITVNDWLDGASTPTFVRQQDSFKTITAVLLVNGGDEETCAMDISKLVCASRGQVDIKFDEDISALTYPSTLESSMVERMKPGVHKLTLTYKAAHAYGKEVSMTVKGAADGSTRYFDIVNKGTAEAPLIMEIKVNNAADLNQINFSFWEGSYIQGPGHTTTDENRRKALGEFYLKNLEKGHTYVVDTDQGTITDKDSGESVAEKFDGYYLPKAIVGTTGVARSWYIGYDVTIKYKPRYV